MPCLASCKQRARSQSLLLRDLPSSLRVSKPVLPFSTLDCGDVRHGGVRGGETSFKFNAAESATQLSRAETNGVIPRRPLANAK